MAIIAGIDEAGFGPVLGPLVVSASVFRCPEADVDACGWRSLGAAVTRKHFRKSPALPVADSKALRVRTAGLVHIERGVLGMLEQMPPAPASLWELLRRVAPGALVDLSGYPWYAGADLPLPRQADAKDISLRARPVAEAMAAKGVVLEAVRCEPVLAAQYNRLVAATRNKSVALFGLTSRLIAHVFNTYGVGGPTRIVVDRQGGRMRYLGPLQRMFQGAAIRIIEESDRRSAYAVRDGDRSADITFVTRAEAESLPVALASMVSKYLRELFMELLNAWWAERTPGLKPTAGYYTDGRRFLRDIAQVLAAQGFDRSLLVRSR